MAERAIQVEKALAAAQAVLAAIGGTAAAEIEKGMFRSPAGKRNVVRRLLPLIPAHKRYVEPFAGGAALFFAKERAPAEVLNDRDPDIAFAYRFIQRMTPETLTRLKRFYWTNTRPYFEKLKAAKPTSDLARFHKFIYLNRFSFFGKGGKHVSYNPAAEGQVFARFDKFLKGKERLEGVTILSEDYEKVIRRFDGPETFFFLDPPFPGYGQSVGEGEFDEERFARVLGDIRGKFLVTYGLRSDRSLFQRFRMRRIVVPTSTPKGMDRRPLLLISNYEIRKRAAPPAAQSRPARSAGHGRVTPATYRPMQPVAIAGARLPGLPGVLQAFAPPARLSAGIAIEPRLAGERLVLCKRGAGVQLVGRDGQDRTRAHPMLVRALQALPGDVVLDGVLVGGVERAAPSFVVHVFDVLAAGGHALVREPWTKRQEVLAGLLKNVRPALARVQSQVVRTEEALRAAIDAARQAPGSTGAVLKLTDARYRPGAASTDWAEVGPASELERLYDRATSLAHPIAKQGAEEERFTLGIVLEPDVVDAQGDRYSKEEVRRACHRFAEFYWNTGLMHREIANGRIVILENYLAPSDFTADSGEPVKEGTWLQGRGYRDDEIWAKIKRGELTGLSIGGTGVRISSGKPASTEESQPTET